MILSISDLATIRLAITYSMQLNMRPATMRLTTMRLAIIKPAQQGAGKDEAGKCALCLPVPHEDERGEAVKAGHHQVRHRQVEQEVVGHTPHAPVGCSENKNNS